MIVIASNELRASIDPLGAELCSLTDAEGRELMTDADPAFWTGHAPILFPIVGGLVGDRYRLRDGRAFSLPRHGFARRSTFEVVLHEEDQAIFRLSDSSETLAVWPFPFQLDMAFTIVGASLAMTTIVTNRGNEAMPFSLGYHPAFAWPLPYGATKEDHRIRFEKPEPGPIRQLDSAGQLKPDPIPSPVIVDSITPTPEMFEDDALIWDQLESRSILWGPDHGPQLLIDFPAMPMLGIWQKPGARYLCIEPWAGIADPAGYDGVLEDKPGIMLLPPGESRAFGMDVMLLRD